jgi:type 1 glutamine amidotransferase
LGDRDMAAMVPFMEGQSRMKAALFAGGWEGHDPSAFADWCRDLLQEDGFEVDVYDTLEPLADPSKASRT